MTLLFVGLLIITVGVTFYLYRKIGQISFASKVIEFTQNDRDSFNSKLRSGSIDNTIELTFTSEELTASFSDGISIKNLLVKNIQVIISESGLEIFGTLIKPLSSQIKIKTTPTIKNGKIKLEITEFNAGKLKFPKLLNTEIGENLNGLMDKNFEKLYQNYDITDIKLRDDEMTITGKLKK